MVKKYFPQQGDLVWLNFNPTKGHEQQGQRLALVVSDSRFNKKTGLVFVCPITNTDRKFSLHFKLPAAQSISGFIMTEQLRSVDFKAREVKFIEQLNLKTLQQILEILQGIVS